MKTLLIATQNPGKFSEMLEVLGHLPYQFVSLKDVDIHKEALENFYEDGKTFEENSFKKARYFYELTGFLTLGEDSGILVDAFPGELGVYTRRWGAGEKATDEEWVSCFLDRMKNVLPAQRGAKFVCVATLYDVHGKHVFVGETKGVITEKLEAPIYKGLPLSACFRPEGFDKVYSAFSVSEKNRVSHRGKAMFQVCNFFQNLV